MFESDQLEARIAQWIPSTEAEGPGKRFAIWFQGCPLRCPGCCNPEMLSFEGGSLLSVEALRAEIARSAASEAIEGITLLGGEPFAHLHSAVAIAQYAQQSGLSVMIFSGFTIEELRARHDHRTDQLLQLTDILVDGPYQREHPETSRRWIGSSNQRIHFLSARYSADDPRWLQPNTLELRLDANGLTVNGFPAPASKPFWQRKRNP